MAHISERETKTCEAKNAPLLEKLPLDAAPENNKKPPSRHDRAQLKVQYFRKRRGRSAKPPPIKEDALVAKVQGSESIKEDGSSATGSRTENTSNGPDMIKIQKGGPENQADVASQAKNVVQVSKVSANPLIRTDTPEDSENVVSSVSSSKTSVNSSDDRINNHSSEQACSSEKEEGVNPKNIAKKLTNSNLHDPNVIFNDLCYEDKLLLQSNYIEVLKKKSDKYPLALFHCTLCRFYSSTIAICRLHIKNNNHVSDLKERKLLETVRLVPQPTPRHIKALDKMVNQCVAELYMGESERETCLNVAHEISIFVGEKFPGCSLTVYGSIATRLALKESNIDLNLQTPSTVNGPTTLAAIAKEMSSNSNFRDVEKDFDEGRPSVRFVHQKTDVKCCVCLSKEETLKTTEIIAKYQLIDPRVHQLAVIFHKWAKLCKINDYKNGMWPPHTFPLLLIYYLQQCKPPVLPVLHELKGDPEDDSYLDPSELEGKWQQLNKMSVGELWLGLLRFYAIDYAHSERVVCIRKKSPLKRSVKNWIGKRTAIEDPFCVKRNVSRTIIHNFSFKYIMTCFRKSYLYYGIPRTSKGHLYDGIQPTYLKLKKEDEHLKQSKAVSDYWIKKNKKNQFFSFEEEPPTTELKDYHCSFDGKNEINESIPSTFCPEKPSDSAYVVAEELSVADAILFSDHIRDGIIEYDFVAENGNKIPPTICAICTMDGHSKAQCPDAHLPPLQPLPPMTTEFMAHLNDFCVYVCEEYSQKHDDIMKRKEILGQLEEYISAFYPDVQLSLFGSSANGFGFKNSDLDICLTFKGNSSGQGIEVTELIPKLVLRLRKMPSIRNIVPIPSAKVPIIKFKDIYTQLEGDISLYNTLAQHNTQLLQTYAVIDERVKVLGYVMKTFAKLCDICDASRGSLSSYAYILMVIYFLQQCNPPVVPVLQELTDVYPKPVCIQEGQDVWFFRDLSKLEKVWPEYGKNKLSVGVLWLQMLRFYTEEFDFEQYAISIRQKQVVYKFEKMWFKKPMAIEDPFDIQHNLGGALSRKMKLFIIKSLRKGRQHFGVPVNTLPSTVKSWKEYFLNVSCLREGAPPNIGCHICKKIGHKVRNCPEKVNFAKDKRNERNDGEHREGKNNQGFAQQHMEYRRRLPRQSNNRGGQFWSRGVPLVREEKPIPPPGFPVQQLQQQQQKHQVHPPHPLQVPSQREWYSQQWRHMQIQRNFGAPAKIWPAGIMAGGVWPSDNMAMVTSMPTCAAVERDMAKGNMELKQNVFRSAEHRGQYHEPCLSLTQYGKHGKPVGCDDRGKNVQGEGQNLFSGAIPKIGPSSSSIRPTYARSQNVVRNDSGPNP